MSAADDPDPAVNGWVNIGTFVTERRAGERVRYSRGVKIPILIR
jgi:hypothetical protein